MFGGGHVCGKPCYALAMTVVRANSFAAMRCRGFIFCDAFPALGISSSFKERAGDTFYGAIYYLCSAFLIDKIVGFLDNTPLMP